MDPQPSKSGTLGRCCCSWWGGTGGCPAHPGGAMWEEKGWAGVSSPPGEAGGPRRRRFRFASPAQAVNLA